MIKRILLILAVAVALTACGTALTPQQTAEHYLAALAQADFSAAMTYVSNSRRAALEELARLYQTLRPADQDKFKLGPSTVTAVQQWGDRALVEFTFHRDQRGQLNLLWVKGAWKVDQRPTF